MRQRRSAIATEPSGALGPASELIEECPEVSRIALSGVVRERAPWLALLALDGRIGRMVLGSAEPLLGQMRLAWWRDQLGKTVAERPGGEPLLDLIGTSWAGREQALVALVDGWEALLSERPLSASDAMRLVEARTVAAGELARLLNHPTAQVEAARAGALWACADLAVHAQHESERAWAIEEGNARSGDPLSLPRGLRPLAVIGGLARRSLRRGGTPMLGDRLSPLAALRIGIIGR